MTTATEPTATEVADLCDQAAQVLVVNGLNKRHLYDTRQAEGGTKLPDCRVDVIGALNIAAHGTPRYACSRLVQAAEQALLDRLKVPALVTWNDDRARKQADIVQALRDTAAGLRAGGRVTHINAVRATDPITTHGGTK
ncbi:DUF6197 family protein [Streptomyces sp. NPDC002853]